MVLHCHAEHHRATSVITATCQGVVATAVDLIKAAVVTKMLLVYLVRWLNGELRSHYRCSHYRLRSTGIMPCFAPNALYPKGGGLGCACGLAARCLSEPEEAGKKELLCVPRPSRKWSSTQSLLRNDRPEECCIAWF